MEVFKIVYQYNFNEQSELFHWHFSIPISVDLKPHLLEYGFMENAQRLTNLASGLLLNDRDWSMVILSIFDKSVFV